MKNLLFAILLSSLVGSVWGSPAFSSDKKERNSAAKITEARGDVYKRGFIDWEKEVWADPSPATRGDVLQEGMQVGTGEKSWAQLTWSYITARAWANSVYAIAPNQRLVYLMNGEMLYHLDKNRKDKSDYFVWTKLIQARIRGTTVLFQCTKDKTRLTVMEGTVDVMNRKDKSVVRLEPGVVYEVKEVHPEISSETVDSAAHAAVTSTATSNNAASSASGLTNITQNNIPPVTLFQTRQTVSSLLVASPQLLLDHPLVNALESPLSSLPLVSSTLNALLPTVGNLLNGVGGLLNGGLLNQTLLSEVKVLSVPKSLSYKVGPLVGSAFNLPPQSVSFFPPSGVIGQAGNAAALLPGLNGQGAINITDIGNLGGLNKNFGSMVPNVMPNINVVPTSTAGITSNVTGATAGLAGFVNTGHGAVSGGGGIAGLAGGGGVLGGGGGVLGGVLGGGGTGGVGGVLGGAGGTINGVLGGATGGLLGGGGGGGGLLGLPLGH